MRVTSQPSTDTTDSEQKHRLTQDDVKRLLSEPAVDARVTVVSKITKEHGSGKFGSNELLVAEQIFRLLLRDTEVKVRAAMAEGLKDDTTVPKDIIKTLALDEESVAAPVLEHSEVLDDDDLVDIIDRNSEITKFIAIANRKHVSPTVSAALVETEIEDVIGSLVQNDGADISESSYGKIINDFAGSDDIMGSVVKRENLPLTVVENMLNIVSDTVARELKGKYGTATKKLDEEARKTRESMTLNLLDTTTSPDEVQALVDQLYDAGRLTPSIILTALCRGNFAFFEVSLSKMAGIPTANARKLINDKGELGFRSLYNKAELPGSMYEACRLVLNVMKDMAQAGDVNPGSIHYANRVVEKILTRAEGRDIENLAYIIALIRQSIR